MLRTLDVVLIAAMIGAATVTYQIKHRAEDKLDEVHRLQAAIKLQKDTIDLLEADWSLLNQPGRLERLTKEFNEQLNVFFVALDSPPPMSASGPAGFLAFRSRNIPAVAQYRIDFIE